MDVYRQRINLNVGIPLIRNGTNFPPLSWEMEGNHTLTGRSIKKEKKTYLRRTHLKDSIRIVSEENVFIN